MGTECSICEEANRLLEKLVSVNSLKGVDDLFHDHMKQLITLISDDCTAWSVYSAESQVFGACFSRAGVAIARNVNLVLPVLKETMGENADSELKLQHYILLTEYFSINQNLHQHIDEPCTFMSTIIEELIVPGLIWTAGRSAEAIRTAAVCCLCVILQNKIIDRYDERTKSQTDEADLSSDRRESEERVTSTTTELFRSVFDKVVPILLSLMDDKAKKTRLYSMRAVCSIVGIGRKLSCLTDEHVHRAYPVILKRLDDGCDDVRYAAVEALVEVWNAVSEDYDVVISRCHVDALYTTMIIHLDDPESRFQEIMLGMKFSWWGFLSFATCSNYISMYMIMC